MASAALGGGRPGGMRERVVAVYIGLAIAGILTAVYSVRQPSLQTGASTSSASSFSDSSCSASGASATRLFSLAGLPANRAADDTRVIQQTINAAASAGGGVVALRAGTFLIDGHLVLKNNVKLTGVGPATVIKAGPDFLDSAGPGAGYPVISTAGASNVTIANLTADQSGNVLNANASRNGRLSAYLI